MSLELRASYIQSIAVFSFSKGRSTSSVVHIYKCGVSVSCVELIENIQRFCEIYSLLLLTHTVAWSVKAMFMYCG
jgi:hypothetical protein